MRSLADFLRHCSATARERDGQNKRPTCRGTTLATTAEKPSRDHDGGAAITRSIPTATAISRRPCGISRDDLFEGERDQAGPDDLARVSADRRSITDQSPSSLWIFRFNKSQYQYSGRSTERLPLESSPRPPRLLRVPFHLSHDKCNTSLLRAQKANRGIACIPSIRARTWPACVSGNTPTVTRTMTTTMTRAVCATHRRAACTPTKPLGPGCAFVRSRR